MSHQGESLTASLLSFTNIYLDLEFIAIMTFTNV